MAIHSNTSSASRRLMLSIALVILGAALVGLFEIGRAHV